MTEDYELNETPKSARKPDSLISCIDRIEKLEKENKLLKEKIKELEKVNKIKKSS